jgi:hypothetical protein
MLRARYPDKYSELPMPVKGVNLIDPQHLLEPEECTLLKNSYYDGAIRPIPGTRTLNISSLQASQRTRGGHRFYKQDGTKKRLIAYGGNISEVNDSGSETILTTSATMDKLTLFSTWPILDRAYAANGFDNPYYYDGSSFGQLTGTNIPTPRSRLVPVLDRLMAVTINGIERTNARSDSVWSSNSAWATKRPVRPGLFTAIHPFNVRESGVMYPGLLAFQGNAFYIVTGTDYGSDVTNITASTDEDSSIQLLDGTVGTSSPMSVCTVPGVGIFWVTSDLNVYCLPEGSLVGFYVGDKLQTRVGTAGLNQANLLAIDQIWMEYFDRKLLLGFPTGNNAYADTQYWLDLRYLTAGDPKGSVWYGPQTVNAWGCVWREDQGGELSLMAGEGLTTNGVRVYRGYQTDLISHVVGASTVLPTMTFQSRFNGFEGGSSTKYPRDVRLTMTMTGGAAKTGMVDLGDAVAFRQPVGAFSG